MLDNLYLCVHYHILMSKFVIYVNLPKYLSQWLTAKFGDPVVFPASSPQNAIIRTFLSKPPADYVPELGDESTTAIAIPDSVAKPPETFFYMTMKGREAVAESCKDLFLRALWCDISPIVKSSVGLNKLIAAWCESNGIDLDRVETVRQRYYRIRKEFAGHGVNLKSFTRKK